MQETNAPVDSVASTPQSSQSPVRRAATDARSAGRLIMNLGTSIVIKGDLIASEDLTLYGKMEGSVTLNGGHTLTIGRFADIRAAIDAKAVVIQGAVTGNVTAAREGRDSDDRLGVRRRQLSAPRDRRRRVHQRQSARSN